MMKNKLKSIVLAIAVFEIVMINNIGFGSFDSPVERLGQRVDAKPDKVTEAIQQAGQESKYPIMTQPAAVHRWVTGRMGFFPKDAVKAGWDGEDLYVCSNYNTKTSSLYKGRPFYSSGKLHPKYGKCFISYDGQEFGVTTYEVLTGTRLRWVTLTGAMPPNAIRGGQDSDGSSLYVCRAWFQFGNQRLLVPGKFNTNYDKCFVPYGGKEHNSRSAEILIYDDVIKY